MTISQDAKLSQLPGVVELYILDLTSIGGSVLYMTPNTGANGGSVVSFGGQTYQPFPIKGDGWEVGIDGAPPRPTLTVSNVTKFIQSYLTTYGDLVGAKVTRTVTFDKFLDSGSSPDASMVLRQDVYLIEQKKSHNKAEVSFTLASVLDQPYRTIPNWKVLRVNGDSRKCSFPGAGLYRSR